MRKRTRKVIYSSFLCLLSVLILLPDSVLANVTQSDLPTNSEDISSEQDISLQPQEPSTENDVTDPVIDIQGENPDEAIPFEFESVDISPGEVNTGELVTIAVDVNKEVAEVYEITAEIFEPSGGFFDNVEMRYDSKADKWMGYWFVPLTVEDGEWNVEIYADDKEGNMLESLNNPFTVKNPNWDRTDPVVADDLVINPQTANVGDKVKISVSINDEHPGVAYALAHLFDIGDVPLKYNSETKKWEGFIPITNDFSDGQIIHVSRIVAYDKNGNYGDKDFSSETSTFTVKNPHEDYEPPELTAFEMSSDSAKVGETVQINAKVKETDADIRRVGIFLEEYSGPRDQFTSLTFNSDSGEWDGSITVETFDVPGEYPVLLVTEDVYGNYEHYPTKHVLKIENPEIDVNGPTISDIMVTPTAAKIGDEIKISASIEDENPGLAFVGAYMVHQEPMMASLPDNFYSDYVTHIPLTYNAESNKWEGVYKVTEKDISEMYNIYIFACDKHFNLTSEVFTEEIDIINEKEDYNPPVLDYLTITPLRAKQNATLHFEAKLSDDKSGVKSVSVNFTEYEYYQSVTVDLLFNADKGIWEADYPIPPFLTSGFYEVRINYSDRAGNEDYLYPYDLDIYISNDGIVDITPPSGEIISNIPDQVRYGQTIVFEALAVDFDSPVRNVALYLYNYFVPNDIREIQFTYNETEKLWVGKYTVLPSDVFGQYWLFYYAEDQAGNQFIEQLDEHILFLGEYYESPFYKIALDYYNEQDYFNAVLNAGKAIEEGDIREVVKDLMEDASQALLDTGEKMKVDEAKAAYQLLIDTIGVPENIKEIAKARLAALNEGTKPVDPTKPVKPTNPGQEKDNVPPVSKEIPKTGTELPTTSTSLFSLIFAGLSLIAMGSAGLVIRKRAHGDGLLK